MLLNDPKSFTADLLRVESLYQMSFALHDLFFGQLSLGCDKDQKKIE